MSMTFTRKSIGGGLYQHHAGDTALPAFSIRAEVSGVRTFRKLSATTRKTAVIEARAFKPAVSPKKFAELVAHWRAAGCPGRNGPLRNIEAPDRAAEHLLKYFKDATVEDVNRLSRLDGYAEWRRKQIKRGRPGPNRGGGTIRLDLTTQSNILHFGATLGSERGYNDVNQIFRGRKTYQRNIVHAWRHRPENAEAVHAIARELFSHEETEVFGWRFLFSVFMGTRNNETNKLSRAAETDQDAGFIRWLPDVELAARTDGVMGFIYLGQRLKHGINPYSRIGPEFRAMLSRFFEWHDVRFGAGNRLAFFPWSDGEGLRRHSFGARLGVAARRLKLRHVTPHGCRAYFATKHIRDGKTAEVVAALMGDKSAELVRRSYTDNPAGERLHWVPATGAPAWEYFGKAEIEKVES